MKVNFRKRKYIIQVLGSLCGQLASLKCSVVGVIIYKLAKHPSDGRVSA